MRVILAGLDAGGSGSRCLVVDEEGRLLAQVEGEAANLQSSGQEEIRKSLGAIISKACRQAGIQLIDVLGVGLAGCGTPGEAARFQEGLFMPAVRALYLTGDGETAVLGAHGGEPGVVVAAGTGSIICGLRRDGCFVRRGGWGPLLGDEGGGYWIGLQALRAVVKAEEGLLPPTLLQKEIRQELQLEDMRQLISRLSRGELTSKRIAALTPVVLRAMQAGDMEATAIIDRGLDYLGRAVFSLRQELDFPLQKVALSGGVFSGMLFERFGKKLGREGLQPIRPLYPPVGGALLYGVQRAGLPRNFRLKL